MPKPSLHLAQYIEIIKSSQNRNSSRRRVYLFSERLARDSTPLAQYSVVDIGDGEYIYHNTQKSFDDSKNTQKSSRDDKVLSVESLRKWTFQILDGLIALHQWVGTCHGKLSSRNTFVDQDGNIKLTEYGLPHITKNGQYVAFPITHPNYAAPELFLAERLQFRWMTPKADVWALGILLLELINGPSIFAPSVPFATSIIDRLIQTTATSAIDSTMSQSQQSLNHLARAEQINPQLAKFIAACLTLDPSLRPTPHDLLRHPFLLLLQPPISSTASLSPLLHHLRTTSASEAATEWARCAYLWKLEASSRGNIDPTPTLSHGPTSSNSSGSSDRGKSRNDAAATAARVATSPIMRLPLIVSVDQDTETSTASVVANGIADGNDGGGGGGGGGGDGGVAAFAEDVFEVEVPAFAKGNDDGGRRTLLVGTTVALLEKDLSYQSDRIQLFEVLLREYPLSKDDILKEALKDVPPVGVFSHILLLSLFFVYPSISTSFYVRLFGLLC